MLSGQDFVKNHAQRKNIRAAIRGLFQQNFGRHVGGRARKIARLVHRRALIGAGQAFSHAKVKYFDLTRVSEHDIFWLDIAMNDSMLVC